MDVATSESVLPRTPYPLVFHESGHYTWGLEGTVNPRGTMLRTAAMVKHCDTFDHTADVGLAAQGDTLGELLEALAEALADIICPRGQVQPAQRRQIAVRAEDVEALAVDFLTEVLAMMQTAHFVVASVVVRDANDSGAAAEVVGEPYDPARHELHAEVKGITYHQLHVARDGDHWTGRVILDI